MPQPRFDDVKERLLRAGVAPRHVRRYVVELGDHFDDLVGEQTAAGIARGAAEKSARARLGSDADLARVMLERPGLRSLSARHPWAVFVLAPIALPVAALVAVVLVEVASLTVISTLYKNPAHLPPPAWFVDIVAAWNWSATHALPLAIAIAFCLMGIRQRMKPGWIFAAVAIVCIGGAFQQLGWYDTGDRGELTLTSGLVPPFPRDLIIAGIWRALSGIGIVCLVWYAATRWQEVAQPRRGNPDRLLSAETT